MGRDTTQEPLRLAVVRASVTALFLLGSAAPVFAVEAVEVEGEDYTSFSNLGGYDITEGFCSNASGSFYAFGIDVPGEWIQLPINVLKPGCYDSWILAQGFHDVRSDLKMTVFGAGPGGEDVTAYYEVIGQGLA
jgi:hypothetical protein